MTENRRFARLLPEEPLPPYAFVPKSGYPHPTTDPAGHSFDVRHAQPPALDPDRWQESKPYLYGIDLFNERFYWEAHESWESLWHACGRRGMVADFLKALIKLAAAGVKHAEGMPGGTRTHARRAAELWKGLARSLGEGNALFLGLRIKELIALAEEIGRDGWPVRPVILPPPSLQVPP
jgi:uncharacterized protein